MAGSRLNIWDFDDTLVWSGKAFDKLSAQHPEIPRRDWWHDPNVSSLAAEITEPIEGTWARLGNTPGDHIILTGRVLAPVLAWLGWNATHPAVVEGIYKIDDVVSTSGDGNWPVEGTAARKALHVADLCDRYDEVHFYDDHPTNLQTVQGVCPKVRTHQIVDGHFVNRSGWTWRRKKGHTYPPT